MKVHHKAYGEGTVINISGTIIEVDFGGQLKKFQFPKAFGLSLSTEDPVLQAKVSSAKLYPQTGLKARLTNCVPTPLVNPASTPDANSGKRNYLYTSQITSPLVGYRAQTILVHSKAEMFELVGYMATPGRVSSVEAEVPKDGRDVTFEKLFPGQKYRPIELGETPSGMPNKLSPQFRINFASLRNCPETLMENMGKGNGSCVGRINKSKFVIDIVTNYGFRFGEWQDTSLIRSIAEKSGFLEDFERGYRR